MVPPAARESPKCGTSREVPAALGQPEGSCGGLPGAEAAASELSSSIQQLQQEMETGQPQVSRANPTPTPGAGGVAACRWLGGQPLPVPQDRSSLRAGESTRTQGRSVLLRPHWSHSHNFPQQPQLTLASLQCQVPAVSGCSRAQGPVRTHTGGAAWGQREVCTHLSSTRSITAL